MPKPRLKITQDPEKPVAAEVIAQAIVDIAAGVKKMNESRLSRDAIITLIQRHSGIRRDYISIVLLNLDNLEDRWLKKKGSP